MNKNRTTVTVLMMLTVLSDIVMAESYLAVRPQIGYGYLSSSDSLNRGNISHAGLRILLSAGATRKYGLEATTFRLSNSRNFSSIGIVLEQRLWNWFHMGIGTVGYFGYETGSGSPVGLMTNLGWEPSWYESFRPFITYRNDIIFAEHTGTTHSVSIGIKFEAY